MRWTARCWPIWRFVTTPPLRRWSRWPATPCPVLPPPGRRRPDPAPAPLSALAFRHEAVQRLRRLTGRRSARQAEGRFVVEGVKLLGEARSAGAVIEAVYVDAAAATPAEAGLAAACALDGARLFEVQPGVLARACDTVSPQPVAAIVGIPDIGLDQLRERRPDLLVICVDVRDPGNMGTIIRTAGAAGAKAVICCQGAVDVFNPKTVRSSAGMLFHLPVVVAGEAIEVLDEVGRWELRRWGTAAHERV